MDYWLEYVLKYIADNYCSPEPFDSAYILHMLDYVPYNKQHHIASYLCHHLWCYFQVYNDWMEYRLDNWMDEYLELKLRYFYNYVQSHFRRYDYGVEF